MYIYILYIYILYDTNFSEVQRNAKTKKCRGETWVRQISDATCSGWYLFFFGGGGERKPEEV